jgi:hypothetical protein
LSEQSTAPQCSALSKTSGKNPIDGRDADVEPTTEFFFGDRVMHA